MVKATLPVNFQDDIMNSSMGGNRRYKMINNSDGTVSYEDATTYDQVGSNFGAGQMNATNAAVNAAADASKIIDDIDTIGAVTEEGYIAGALALKSVTQSLVANIYVGDDGKLHKLQGGADSVLPFKSGFVEAWVKYNYSKLSCMDSDGNLLHNQTNIYNKDISGNYLNVAYANSNYTITALQDCTVVMTLANSNYNGSPFVVASLKAGDITTEWKEATGSLVVL